MESLKNYDFSSCRYDPKQTSFVSKVTQDIPTFADYTGSYRKNIFVYVVIMYDKHSPLQERFPDYYKRKMNAAHMASLPFNDNGSFPAETKEILEGMNQGVNKLIVAYLANLSDVQWIMLVNEWSMLLDYTNQMLFGMADKKDANYKTMNDLSTNIESRTRRLFGSGEYDELARVRELLYERAEGDRQKFNIEAVVQTAVEHGGIPNEWGPYGGDYTVKDIKFEDDE